MSVAIVIPARRASSRLPLKMLLSQTGKPLIQHTYEQAKKSTLAQRVLIATDDKQIFKTAQHFGAEVVMTSVDHPTGTDRLAEVASKHLMDIDLIINVQGDEPELEPDNIDTLIRLFRTSHAQMGTLVTRFSCHTQIHGSPNDPNCVKAVLGAPVKSGNDVLGYEALYFSRSIVPYPRDEQGQVKNPSDYFLHLGIYAYQPEFLKTYVTLEQRPMELTEKLEQLRVLEHGYKVVAGIVSKATPGIDTQRDYDNFVQRFTHGI